MAARSLRTGRLIATGIAAVLATASLSACSSDSESAEWSDSQCEAYPTEPIDLIVPYAAGGGFDAWARLLAPYLKDELGGGIDVRVENIDGGGGMRAMNQIAAAPADGTQIVLTEPGFPAVNQILGRVGDDFDVTRLSYLAQVTVDPQVFAVAPDSDVESIGDLKGQSVKHAAQDISPIETIVYAETGVEGEAILHDSTSETFLAIERGDADITVTSLSSIIEYLKTDKVRPILFVGTEEVEPGLLGYDHLKGVETAADIGHPELNEVLEQYRVIAAPPNLPQCVQDKLESAILATLDDPEFIKKAEGGQLRVIPGRGDETKQRVMATYETFEKYEDALKTAVDAS